MDNQIKHDLHAMLLIAAQKNCGHMTIEQLLKMCENNDPQAIDINDTYRQKSYGKHITWCKSKFNTMGVKKAIGGNAYLVFEAIVEQAIENNETIVSYRELAEQTGMSVNTVKTCLQKCEDYGLIVTTHEGMGSSPNVYKINPQLVLIGKYTNKDEGRAITNFYKLTGTEYGFNTMGAMTIVKQSSAHANFENLIKEFNETHVRGIRAYVVGDKQRIAGSFLTPEEAKANKKKYKNMSVSDDDETDDEDDDFFKNI